MIARGSGGRVAAETGIVWAVALAYLWVFRLYGFDLVDEGTQLAQIDRVAQGALPYVDFETGYTPGYFALHSALWALGGPEVAITRTFGVLLQATVVAATWVATRWLAGPMFAVAAAAVHLAFLHPVSLSFGAPFNIPYPGWLAAPLALAAQVASATSPSGGRARFVRLFLVGLVCGLSFSVKPNTGLLTLGGVALTLPMWWAADRRSEVVLGAFLRLVAVACGVALLGPGLDAAYAVALLLPLIVAAWRSVPEGEGDASAWLDIAALGGAFLLPVATWLVPLVGQIGVEGLLQDVLLLDGGGVVGAYLVPFPRPHVSTVGYLLTLVAASTLVGTRGGGAPSVLAAGTVVSSLMVVGARIGAENLLHWLPSFAVVLGMVAAGRRRDRALIAFAAVALLQLFPRPDLIHVAQAAPPLFVVVAVSWRDRARRWMESLSDLERSRRTRLVGGICTGAVLLLAVGRAVPVLVPVLGGDLEGFGAGPRAPVRWVPSRAEELRWVGRVVERLRSETDVDAPIAYFPDLAGVGFLADRSPRSYYMYFVPGRPDHTGERRAIEYLARERPPFALVGEPQMPVFAGAGSYFSRFLAEVAANYGEPQRFGPARLLRRRDQQGSRPNDGRPPGRQTSLPLVPATDRDPASYDVAEAANSTRSSR